MNEPGSLESIMETAKSVIVAWDADNDNPCPIDICAVPPPEPDPLAEYMQRIGAK